MVEHRRSGGDNSDGWGRDGKGERGKRRKEPKYSTSSASEFVSRVLNRTLKRIAVSPKASKRFWAIVSERDMAEAAAGSYI